MKIFNDDSPLYLQLRRHIEELILERHLQDGQVIPSIRVMSADYGVNPLTVSNALGALVEEGILYKKRGVGIFVASGARSAIIAARAQDFIATQLQSTLIKARQLDIPKDAVTKLLNETYGGSDV
ncbi:MAG: GntR family transcriptional regulator [Candidatus Cloacimonetes bacterium]|nr:GntR family transcriptional regulator [Candidatus Cloacimonadota bacterium]